MWNNSGVRISDMVAMNDVKSTNYLTGSVPMPGSITGSTMVCQNAMGVVYSVKVVPSATGYSWTVPSGASIISGQGSTAIAVNFGTTGGNVCVTANNACGTSAASCLNMTFGTFTPGTLSSNQTICSGLAAPTLTFITPTTAGTGNYSYQWYDNAGIIPSATNSSYSPGILPVTSTVYTESFDELTFPPTGWYSTVISDPDCTWGPPYCPYVWMQATTSTTGCPQSLYGGCQGYGNYYYGPVYPHSGTGMAWYDSGDAASGDNAILVTPSFSEAGNTTGANVNFWMYGNSGDYGYNNIVNVYYSTSATQPTSTLNASLLGTVVEYNPVTAWYQHSFTIPGSVTSSAVWLIFEAVSDWNYEMYIDDVSWTSVGGPGRVLLHYFQRLLRDSHN